MAQNNQEIEIKNNGPISYAKLLVPRRGGVLVLYGPNGSGKSTALDAINQLVSRQGKLITKDGTAGAEITGFNARVAFGRRLSRSGELEVLGLEGFSIADLVDPKVKDDLEARDAHRIKALLRLANANAKAEMFYQIVGGQEEFDKYVPSNILATDDLVSMQISVKRALEAAARAAAAQAEVALRQAEASRLAASDIDTTLPDDSELLSAVFEDATRTEERLKSEARTAQEAIDKAKNAGISLEVLKETYKGPTVEDAAIAQEQAEELKNDCSDRVVELSRLLAQAKTELTDSEHILELANQKLAAATQYRDSVEALVEAASCKVQPITPDQLTKASQDLKNAKEAVETGALVRRAKADLAKAEKLKTEGLEAQRKSEDLRTAARASELVLSSAVEGLGVPLKVFGSRLVATNTDRPNEVFDDLSEGEQWKIAADIAVTTVGPGGVIILPQRAWQDLDQKNKQILAEGVESKDPNGVGVVVITAQADSNYDEVTPQLYDPFALAE